MEAQRVLLCFATKLKSVLSNSHNYAAVKWSQYVVIIDTAMFTVLTMLMRCDKLPSLSKLKLNELKMRMICVFAKLCLGRWRAQQPILGGSYEWVEIR